MLRVRTTKLSSGNISVQVVHRHNHRTDIVKHVGTAKDDKELEQLKELAGHFIKTNDTIPPLLPEVFGSSDTDDLVSLKHLQFTSSHHTFAYEFLSLFYERNGFSEIDCSLLKDLAIMRIVEPASKLRSTELLKEYFAISYPINRVYEQLRKIRLFKDDVEKAAVSYAQKHLGFDFSLVFYDVTTLYFETFKEDGDVTDEKGNTTTGLRKQGFGKERKPGQPQIVIGLVVNNDGYPIAVEMFSGKTFEGHTMLPVVKSLKERYGIKTLTIVADAAMLSLDNTKAIVDAKLSYIVGARMGSIPAKLLNDISKKLEKTENKYIRVETNWGTLICDYSEKRAAKDRSDRKKQFLKAQYQIDNPDKAKRRTRFVTEETKATLTLNQELIDQDTLREGIKGYYTNLKKVSSKLVVNRYHDLWHVEKSFRITKSDLEARPIFHHKRESIETHILIVFVSLCIAKSIELKTGYSIKKVRDVIWRILDAELVDTLTNKKFTKRMETAGNEMAELLTQLASVDNSKKRVLKK
jgi:hypothetical protein